MKIIIKRISRKDENEKISIKEAIEKVSRREGLIQKMYASIKPDTMKAPTHFPCAARVKMPQLGSEDSEIKIRKPHHRSSMILYHSSDLSKQPVQESYIKRISRGLSFEEDVVRDRCFHTLPYDSKYFWEVLAVDGLVPIPAKSRIPVGRHNARGSDVRHMPCGIASVTKGHQLKPLKRKIMDKAMQMHQQALMAKRQEEMKQRDRNKQSDEDDDISETCIFMTEVSRGGQKDTPGTSGHVERTPRKDKQRLKEDNQKVKFRDMEPSETQEVKVPEKIEGSGILQERAAKKAPSGGELGSEDVPGGDWDAYLLSILSPLTANWVVHERMSPSEDKENLTKVLSGWYGVPEHTDLVRDDVSVTDLDAEPKKDKKKSKKVKKEKELTFFEKIKAEVPKRAVDPYSDDNQAPFYRQPTGIRRQRKTEEKEEAVRYSKDGAINSTAHAVTVKTYNPSPPPTLRDFINPAVGDKMFDTNNMFVQEWLTGAQQVFDPLDSSKIKMGTDNKYKKQLQKEYPMSPQCWFPDTDSDMIKATQDAGNSDKITRGLRRWKGLPEPVDDTAEVVNIVPPGYDPEFHRSPDPTTKRITKQNASLMQIIGEWRSKWHLSGQYADSNPMDLIRDMADIQPHVRLKAIATVARASEYKPPSDSGIQLEYQEKQTDTETKMPNEVFIALNCLLEDEHNHVQKAAAITLYSLNRPSDKAEVILREALTSDNGVDRWAAAQCLAHFGVCDSDVVGEIISQLLDTEDAIKHEHAILLLSKISNNSTLVHCMVAEQLNSTSWRHKVIACKILPTLHGTINKDISNKLSELMWNDWHSDVRRAAAQCLGKTQHGRDVHDDLRNRINSPNERIRLEAISKVGHLGIMTAKLLPAFLKCFDDPYVSVRIETCITSGNLEIQDERVLKKLVYLATYDPIWRVKALSIQALGCIGKGNEEITHNEEIRECLMWALRYEEKEGVRAEACHSLMALKMTDDDFVEVLQDRLLVETSLIVRDEMVEALRQLGVSTSEDMDMVAQIKGEVRKLCNRDVIASQIMVNEMHDDRRENLKRMVYETEQELEEHKARKEKVLKRIRSLTRMSSSGTRPHTQTGSRSSSAAHSREGTMFTPSADKELEALMSREDTREDVSDRMTPTTGSVTIKSRENTVTGTLSRPGTSGTRSESQLSSEESGPSHRIKSATSTKSKTEDSETFVSGGDTPGFVRMDSMSDKRDRLESISEHAQKEPKPNLHLPAATGLTVSACDVRASRLSFIGPSTDRKALVSRETLKEREMINTEALNTYMGLESRYSSLDFDLMAIDSGLNTSESIKDGIKPVRGQHSEKVVASVVITSPSGSAVLLDDKNDERVKEIHSGEGTDTITDLTDVSEEVKPTESPEGTQGQVDAEVRSGQPQDEQAPVQIVVTGTESEKAITNSATDDDSADCVQKEAGGSQGGDSKVEQAAEDASQGSPEATVQVVVTGTESDEAITTSPDQTVTDKGSAAYVESKVGNSHVDNSEVGQVEDAEQGSPESGVQVFITSTTSEDDLGDQ